LKRNYYIIINSALNLILFSLFLYLFLNSIDDYKIGSFFNGDTVYLPSLYKDIFIDRFSISGWHFSAAPSFFPDMLLYFILMFITGDLTISTFIYAIIQPVLLLLSFLILLKLIFRGFDLDSLGAACIIFSVIFFLSINSISMFNIFIFLFIPNYHFSVFIMSMFSLILLIRYLQSRNFKYLSILFILTLITSSSDLLFLEMFVLPAILTLIILYLLKLVNKHDFAYFILTVAPAGFIALMFYYVLKKNYMLSVIQLPKNDGFDFFSRISVFINEIKNNSSFMIVFISLILLLIFSFIFFKKTRANLSEFDTIVPIWTYKIFSCILAVFAVFFPAALLDREAMVTLRYSCFVPFILLFNTVIYYLFYLKTGHFEILKSIKSGVFCTLFIFAFFRLAFPLPHVNLINYYPPLTKFLDDNSDRYKLKFGISNYSNAKLNTVFSKKGIRVYQIQIINDKLFPYFHINNHNWYIDEKGSKYSNSYYNFILSEGLPPEGIIKIFGMPADFIAAPQMKLLVFNGPDFNEKIKKIFAITYSGYFEIIRKNK